jgi:hypothetical protein
MSGMVGRQVALALGALVAGAGMAAAQTCTFSLECLEAEACTESGYALSIEKVDGTLALVDDASVVPVSVGGSNTVRVHVGVSPSAFHVLTLGGNGFARYTTHNYDGPFALTYLGTCE